MNNILPKVRIIQEILQSLPHPTRMTNPQVNKEGRKGKGGKMSALMNALLTKLRVDLTLEITIIAIWDAPLISNMLHSTYFKSSLLLI